MDDGRGLGLIIGQDSFTVLPPEPTLFKLYMPLTSELYERNEYGDMDNEPIGLDGRELREYESGITSALLKNRMPKESEHGIMHWYHENDSVNEKVKSVVFAVEERDGKLWSVAEYRAQGQLTLNEMNTLADYITGQASDGCGEGFDQQEIHVGGVELYVHLWNSDHQSIMTKAERFNPKQEHTPPQMGGMTLG